MCVHVFPFVCVYVYLFVCVRVCGRVRNLSSRPYIDSVRTKPQQAGAFVEIAAKVKEKLFDR